MATGITSQRARRDRQAGPRQAVVPDVAHVEEEGEEHHRERDAERQRGRVDRAVGAVAEQAQVDQRRRARGAPRRRSAISAITPVAAVGRQVDARPGRRLGFDDGQRDRADGDDQQRHADAVDAAARGRARRLLQQPRAAPQRDRADRQVDEEGPRPADASGPRTSPGSGPPRPRSPPTAPHRLTVSARLLCGNAASTIDSDAGVSSAAPTACSTRAAISHATLPARPQAADAAMNSVTPNRNTRLRP